MKRRAFLSLLTGAAAAWPLAARAQPAERMRRIGVLIVLTEDDPEAQLRVAVIQKELQQRGWLDGRNVTIDYRWAAGSAERIQAYAAELIELRPDVILAGSTSALAALHRQTRSVPIVFAQVADPVGRGFVASLARPGGNITGFALFEEAIAVKWLELLKQLAPAVARAGIIYDPANPASAGYLRAIEAGGRPLRIAVSGFPVRNPAEIERAIQSLAGTPDGGLIVSAGPLTAVHRELIIALAARHRLPAVYTHRYFVASGGLASYGSTRSTSTGGP